MSAAPYSIVEAAGVGSGDWAYHRNHALLVDRNGIPCAKVSHRFSDLDPRHEFDNGDVLTNPESMPHEIDISFGPLDGPAYRRLKLMEAARSDVLFTPGFGPKTELAYRPLRWLRATEYDLTGRYRLIATGDVHRGYVWDDVAGRRGVPLAFASGEPALLRSPWGALQRFDPARTNILEPGDDVFWHDFVTAGAGVTTSLSGSGFPASGYDNVLHVTGASSTSNRQLDITVTGLSAAAGIFDLYMPIRGRVTHDTVVSMWAVIGDIQSIDLSSEDLGDWKILRMRCTSSASSTTVNVRFNLDANGEYETFDFEIGQTAIFRAIGSTYAFSPAPAYLDSTASATSSRILTFTNVALPGEATIFSSLYVPEWFDSSEYFRCGLCSFPGAPNAAQLGLINYSAVHYPRLFFYYGTASAISTSEISLQPGKINTVAATWDEEAISLFVNGQQAASAAHVMTGGDAGLVPGTMQIGTDLDGTGQMGGILLHGLRIEREAWSSARISQEHFLASSAPAMGPAVAARGRTYKIATVQADPVARGDGSSGWVGRAVLRQSAYSVAMSDICTCEGDYP